MSKQKKETFYFSHDYNARNDQKILELRRIYGAEGYGLYWMMVEVMAENTSSDIALDILPALAYSFNVDSAMLTSMVNKCLEIGLFVGDGEFITSSRIQQHKKERQELKRIRTEAINARWERNTGAGLNKSNTNVLQNDTKERKGKESNTLINKSRVSKSFAPPSPDQVKTYIQERGLPDPERLAEIFITAYQKKDWMVGKNKMKDWKAAIRNWQVNDYFNLKPKTPAPGQQITMGIPGIVTKKIEY